MSKLMSCINISRVLPVTKLSQNINAISSLVYNDDDVLDSFLQKVDQPLDICKETGDFICCEYNRDGDSFRKPGTGEFYPPSEDSHPPSENLLNLEDALNKMFKIYVKFYYTPSTVASVFCYLIDEDDPNKFVVAVLIRNAIDESKKTNGKWESSNLITVDCSPNEEKSVKYDCITSVNVYLNTSMKVGNDGKLNMGGSITKRLSATKNFNNDGPDTQFHVENIGKLVEDIETNIRDEIEKIYFSKTNEILGTARINPDREINQTNIHNILKGNL